MSPAVQAGWCVCVCVCVCVGGGSAELRARRTELRGQSVSQINLYRLSFLRLPPSSYSLWQCLPLFRLLVELPLWPEVCASSCSTGCCWCPPRLATSSLGLEFGAADTCRIKSRLLAVRHLTLYQLVRSDRQLLFSVCLHLCPSLSLCLSLNQSVNQSVNQSISQSLSVHSKVVLDPRPPSSKKKRKKE